MTAITRVQFDFDQIDERTKKITPALIAAVTDRIVHYFKPHKVILFGSQASGKASRESDIDLLVVIDDRQAFASLMPRERSGKLLELFRYRSFGLDAIVLTGTEVQELREANEGEWDLILEILEEGQTLYERSQNVPVE
jgi:predicted nucleotidyltransferase